MLLDDFTKQSCDVMGAPFLRWMFLIFRIAGTSSAREALPY